MKILCIKIETYAALICQKATAWSFAICLILFITTVISVNAQDGIDHGPLGTLNHDYFSTSRDPGFLSYKSSLDNAHAKPGLVAFAEGNMRETQVQLEYVLLRTINHPQMLALAALFSIRTKNPMWAMPYFERALSYYPQYALTHAQYGKYLTEIGMVDKGLEQLTKASEMDPNLVAAYVWLEAAYKKSGNLKLARQSAEKARSLGYQGKLSD